MGQLLIGNNEPHEILLGNDSNGVQQIYLGNELIWEKPDYPWVLYDRSVSTSVNGITWAQEKFSNPSGYSNDAEYAHQTYGMFNYSTSTSGYGNWATSTPIYVPHNATYLKVQLGYYSSNSRSYYSFGFFPASSSKMTVGAISGQMTGRTALTTGYEFQKDSRYYRTYSLTIGDQIKCTDTYCVFVNFLGSVGNVSGARGDLYIYKVWFE